MPEARWRSSTSMTKPYHITHYLHLTLLCDFLFVLVLDTRRYHRIRKSLNKYQLNCVLPYMCNCHKVISYEAGRDDQGQAHRSSHKAWVQVMYVPRNTVRLNWRALVCADIASEHRRPKFRAWVAKLCDWHKHCLPSTLHCRPWRSREV
jgi:hypothetical protein